MKSLYKKNLLLLSAVFVFLSAISGCSAMNSFTSQNKILSDTGFYFDTVVKITLCGTDDSSILEECFALMADFESVLSRTREGSDIWNINHSQGKPVEVCSWTIELLEKAIYYSELSDGAFDPTIAPVMDLWQFTDNPQKIIPPQEMITEALSHVDYRSIQISGNTVALLDPDASIDLGGIAKGYIADQLKTFLINKKVTNALINLGGNNLALGSKSGEQPWKIGIQKPFSDSSDFCSILEVNDQSVVTSGNYERYFEKDGTLYHHLIDTQTGYPANTGLNSVTILSDLSCDGDALSTICFAMGLEKGLHLIESISGIEALFVTKDGTIHTTSGFPA